ncbi:hypothetical protein BGX28_001827 [Mortierella sp. GBA30]|nr:hypothetical protein BGX28_001827 [Mortierella sp. GBA30]
MTVEFVFPDWTPEPFRWFLSSVHQFPLLGSLEITSTILDRECAFQLWTVLPQLESLALSEVFFPDMNAATEAMAATTCPRLSNLYLHLDHIKLSPLHQARLLLSCPALKTLQWYLNANEDSPLAFEHTQLNLILARAQLPELEAFYTEGNFLDTQIALVLKAMNTARSLRFTSNSFGLESFGALRPHLSTLKELSIQDCKAMTSAMVQTVLCSCPVLEMLMLDWMFAKDAVQNAWAWEA